MNNGKICVSVCAETAEELIEQINRAEDLADVIEIRFDFIDESEFDTALQKVSESNCKKPFLATFRPQNPFEEITFGKIIFKDENKKNRIRKAITYRMSGWEKILISNNYKWVDLDADIVIRLIGDHFSSTEFNDNQTTFTEQATKNLKKNKIILSEHFYNEMPEKVEDVYNSFVSDIEDYLNVDEIINPDVIKIAAKATDITDTISIWKLLKRAKSDNKQIIPIAMGEAGKWTRILGLAHGAFMTYASLDAGQETAPGQVSVADLIEVYRAKELDEETEIYGILGSNTSVSMSPYIHNAAFKFHKLNSVFIPLQTHNLDKFMRRMVRRETREIELNFKGFSVTIPHKQAIIKHLDFIDETAEKIGAVNTVKIVNGKLHGYNTDAQGFIEPLLNSYGDLKDAKIAVLGAGGAARACIYALKQNGAEVTIFARDLVKAKSLAEDFEVELKELPKTKDQRPKTNYRNFDVLVNTTPLGMKGKADGETPVLAKQLKGLNLVYDLVYIPFQTPLMTEADIAEVPKIGGLAMLIAQAMEQQKIWTGKDAPMKEMSQAALKRLT